MKKIIILLFLLLPLPCFATAFGANTQWDVRTAANSGSDTNGGGFDPGVVAPGTNESMGAGTSISCTVQTTTTTAVCVPAITSTTHGPGNFIGTLTGSGCSATARFELLSQSSGTGTFSTTLGTAASVCTGVIGGSLLTVGAAVTSEVSNNTIWIQTGTYSQSATITTGYVTAPLWFIGYGTTHGDGGTAPLLTTATNSTVLFTMNTSGHQQPIFINISMSNTASTRAAGFYNPAGGGPTLYLAHVTMDGFSAAVDFNTNSGGNGIFIYDSLIENWTVNGIEINAPNGPRIYSSILANGTGDAVYTTSGNSGSNTELIDTIIGNVTGHCVNIANTGNGVSNLTFINNDFVACTTGAVLIATIAPAGGNQTGSDQRFQNNIFYANGGFNISTPTYLVGGVQTTQLSVNKFNAFDSLGNVNWPTGMNVITLTANPFNGYATGDFSLNTAAGGGALLRGLGYPGTFHGGSTVGYLDVGAVQHQDTGASVVQEYGSVN